MSPPTVADVRTTIRLPDALLRQAKRHAARRRQTLTALIADSLRTEIARDEAVMAQPPRPKLPTFRGDGLHPGVSLDASSALQDHLDGLA